MWTAASVRELVNTTDGDAVRPGVLAGLDVAGVVAPRAEPAAEHQDGQHHGPDHRGRHAAAVRRHRPGVHASTASTSRSCRRAASTRSTTTARVRPVVPVRHAAAPGAARGDHAVAVVTAAARPAGRRTSRADKDKDGDDDAPPRTEVDLEGLAERVVALPVQAARYGDLHAVKNGLVWLRYPLAGVLGHDGDGEDDEDRPRPPSSGTTSSSASWRRSPTVSTASG